MMITISNAHFLTSASKLSECPPPSTSEIAMLGRSNVGKSTFINTLLESNLAKSSSTPGKTRLINFFTSIWHDQEKDLHIPISVGKSTFINTLLESNLAKSSSTPGKTRLINFFTSIWHDQEKDLHIPISLIDLPGIGYAKVSKQELTLWQRNLWEFLQQRSSIKLFIHLIDARHQHLIDLPGIGYAKVSKQELTLWQRNLWEFLQQRSSIKLFIHLIDARHQHLAIDSNLASQIQAILRGDQILLPIYTKADKLTKNDLAKLKQKAALITTNNATIARTIYRPKSPQDPTLLPIYTKADKLTKNDLAKLKQKAALITTNNATIARTIYRPKSPQDPTLLDMIRERIFYALLGDISTDMPNKG